MGKEILFRIIVLFIAFVDKNTQREQGKIFQLWKNIVYVCKIYFNNYQISSAIEFKKTEVN